MKKKLRQFVSVEAIPASLVALPQWVGWRYVDRDGRSTKLPIDPRTRRAADSTDATTWGTFADAMDGCEQGGDIDGVGFVFTADDTFCGIDLDGCVDEEGRIADEAQQIIDACASYTEISPSGRGVKIFIRGEKPGTAKCRSRHVAGFKEVEIYDRGRFFTVTGDAIEGTPRNVVDAQSALDDLCARLWPPEKTRRLTVSSPSKVLDDDEVIRRASEARNGEAFKRLMDGCLDDHGGDHSAADAALCCHLVFWCGDDVQQIDRIFRTSGLRREKWDRADYRDLTINNALRITTERYTGHAKRNGTMIETISRETGRTDGRPRIMLTTEEHAVIDAAIEALGDDVALFQRGNCLVRVLCEDGVGNGINRPEGSPVIAPIAEANLRARLTRHALFNRYNSAGEVVPAHPTAWLVRGVHTDGQWDGIRHLTGVSETPVLRPDGSIWQTPGYDDRTGVLYAPSAGVTFPKIDPEVTADDADAALESLLEVVCDFHFESDDHRAAWLAALLTPLARFAFQGPAPFFLIDANVPGAGKGLLAQAIGRIVLGRDMPVSSYSHHPDEMRKKITAFALAGDRMILLDNIDGQFGNEAIDRVLTTTRWEDRLLGKSERVSLPMYASWYGTGNNVQVAADTARRVVHIRLDVLEEFPERRGGFRHPDLPRWIGANQPKLIAAAFTILSSFIQRGQPTQGVTPYGSYEGWSDVVRQAVIWAGMPDPCNTRMSLSVTSDTTRALLERLIQAFTMYDANGKGIVISPTITKLYPSTGAPPSDEASALMRSVLEELTEAPSGKVPGVRQVGNQLRRFQGRVCNGRRIVNTGKTNRGALWAAVEVSEGSHE